VSNGGGLAESAEIVCPYCGEVVEVRLDPGGGHRQTYVEDCEVCCRPWQVSVTYDGAGGVLVTAERSD